jgi:hypothetical protein
MNIEENILRIKKMMGLLSEITNSDIKTTNEPSTDSDELVRSDWFNIDLNKLTDIERKGIEQLYKNNKFENIFKQSVKNLLKRYPKVNKIVARKDGKIVGYLIWVESTPKMEGIKDLNPTIKIPVIVSTAISPDYRGQGLYNNLFKNSGIGRDYLVHVSNVLSPYEFWGKKGCKTIREINYQNKILYCKFNN